MADIPQSPTASDNSSLHSAINDTITYIRDRNENGLKFNSYTQDEIDGFTDLDYEGTMVYNSTTGKANVSYLDGSNVSWKEL